MLFYFDLQLIRPFIMFHYKLSQNSAYVTNSESIPFIVLCNTIIFCSQVHLQPPKIVNV